MCEFLTQLSDYSNQIQLTSFEPLCIPISLLYPTSFYVKYPLYTMENLHKLYKNHIEKIGPFFIQWKYNELIICATIFKVIDYENYFIEFQKINGNSLLYEKTIEQLKQYLL